MHLRSPTPRFRHCTLASDGLIRLAARCAMVLSLLVFTSTTYAADLSGKWTASSLRVSWSIGDWGAACGPRPSGGGQAGGTVTLTPSGSGFQLTGLGRNYSSNQCWERMEGLSPKGHSAGSSAIQTTCRMPSGDPRQATVITTWYPRGDEIYFDETGQYQFVLSGSNCTASVRRTRVLTRMLDTPEPEPVSEKPKAQEKAGDPPADDKPKAQAKAPTVAPPPAPARASHCMNVGKAVSLEVTPKAKLMRLGESFQFQALARDQNGCRAQVNTRWTLVSGQGGQLKSDGTLTVPADAQPDTLVLEASVADHSVKVTARIVTESEYEALIAGGEYGVLGESLDGATIRLSTSHVEFKSETADSAESSSRRLLLIIGGISMALICAGLLWLARQRRRSKSKQRALPEVPPEAADSRGDDSTEAAAAPARASAAKPARLCPVCGKRYEDETMFCAEDGARLVRAN